MRSFDVVVEVIHGDHLPVRHFLDEFVELLGSVRSQVQTIDDAQMSGRLVDIESNAEALHPLARLFLHRPHVCVDREIAASRRPTLFVRRFTASRCQVQTERVDSAGTNCRGHAPQMIRSRFAGRQMPETIDRVKSRIVGLLHFKVGHIADECTTFDLVFLKPLVAELNRFRIQVIAADFEPFLAETIDQATGTTSRLEQPFDFAVYILAEQVMQESHLSSAVAAEHKVVVNGEVVYAGSSFFHDGQNVGSYRAGVKSPHRNRTTKFHFSPSRLSASHMQAGWLRDEHKRRNSVTAPNADAFAEHRARTTGLILQARRTDSDRVCILGAGNCNDLDLPQLTSAFHDVRLVDLHDEAVQAALHRHRDSLQSVDERQVPQDIAKVSSAGDFDLSGLVELLDSAGREAIPPTMRSATAIRERLQHPAPRPWPSESFDCVTSCCLLSQLIDSLILTFGPAHPELVTMILQLRHHHLQLIIDMLQPGGRGILISDFVSSATLPELATVPESDVPPLLRQALSQRNFFTGLNPIALREMLSASPVFARQIDLVTVTDFWRWSLGKKQFGVCGYSFVKRVA